MEESGAATGRHHIFLGYAVGVGKTSAMLDEAARLSKSGADVVIGVLEPHGRGDVAKRSKAFECLPPLQVQHRGLTFPELDVTEVLRRKPEWLLVDELAHETTPGTPYAERWQAVDEVLEGGVNVLSTLNVQHVESLNDFVFQVTGVRVHEVVPDCVLGDAEKIALVDLSPDTLIERVRHGGVYQAGQAGTALTHFFQRSTLEALRREAKRIAEAHG